MKCPSFSYGVAVALAMAAGGAALMTTLAPLLGPAAALRLIVPAMGLAYLVSLLGGNGRWTGRITTLTLWFVVAGLTWLSEPPIGVYVLIHAVMLWLVRSLYFHASAFPALLDLGLSTLSIAVATWAITRSGSLFLATWCFFLVQAAFVVIPQRLGLPTREEGMDDEAFECARRRADAALRQLFLH